MNAPSVAFAFHPSFIEFEAVLDHAAQSEATLRRAFVKRFFDFMLAQRMNFNVEGVVHDVLEEVVIGFVDTYEANIAPPTDSGPQSRYYGGVADWLRKHRLDETTVEIIDSELTKRLLTVRSKHNDVMEDELFNESDQLPPSHLVNKWLDHIELLNEIGEGRRYVSVRRILTILARCHKLLLAHVVTNEGR